MAPRPVKKPAALALEGPSSLSAEELLVEGSSAEGSPGSATSPEQRIWIPSALEKGKSEFVPSRATSTTGSASSESVDSDWEELDAFDWISEETRARVTVSSRAARAEDAVSHLAREREIQLKGSDLPSNVQGKTTYVEGSSSSEEQLSLRSVAKGTSSLEYDAEAVAESARSASQLADAAELYARSNWATAVIQVVCVVVSALWSSTKEFKQFLSSAKPLRL